jgi:hypothetical protein
MMDGMIRFRPPRQIASDPVSITDMCWSPDGEWLCYAKGLETICLLNVSSAEERTLTEGATPAYSAEGRSILFARDGGLFEYDIGRNEEREITINDRSLARLPKHSPVQSPDGQRIVFQCLQIDDRELRRKRGFFCVCDSDGSSVCRLDVETLGGSATWSPDSNRVAIHNCESGARLFMVKATGGHEGRFHGLCPTFSPGSVRLAYKSAGGVLVRSLKEDEWEQDKEPMWPIEGARKLSYNPLAWLDEANLLAEEDGRVWLIDLERREVKPVGEVPTIVRRGCPTLAWKPGASAFAAEVGGDTGSALALFESDSAE